MNPDSAEEANEDDRPSIYVVYSIVEVEMRCRPSQQNKKYVNCILLTVKKSLVA